MRIQNNPSNIVQFIIANKYLSICNKAKSILLVNSKSIKNKIINVQK